jgi:hypothetical protein
MTICQNLSPVNYHRGRTMGLGRQNLLAIVFKGTGYTPTHKVIDNNKARTNVAQIVCLEALPLKNVVT